MFRVLLLGRHVQTNDELAKLVDGKIVRTYTHGNKTHIGNTLFTDQHRRLLDRSVEDGTTPSSLIAVPGKCVLTFREFVIFNPDQIFVEYLVAYRCIRSLGDCGVQSIQRTVIEDTTLINIGINIYLCGGNKEQRSRAKPVTLCKHFVCSCGQSASVKACHSGKHPRYRSKQPHAKETENKYDH